MPWSRLVIAAYNTSTDPNSLYPRHITQKRAEAMALVFIKNGIDPRRIQTKSVVLNGPVLIDPYDNPARYNQAVEVIALDY